MGALASIWPDQVMACSQGTSAILTLGGVDPRSGRRYVSYETIKGGFGARPTKDGINVVASGISNTMNTPVEVLEMAFPVRIERYEINPDFGRRRALSRRLRRAAHLAPAGRARTPRGSLCMERMTSPPFGLLGGKAGSRRRRHADDARRRHAPSAEQGRVPCACGLRGRHDHARAPAVSARWRQRDPAAIGRDLARRLRLREGGARGLRRRRCGGTRGREQGRLTGRSADPASPSLQSRSKWRKANASPRSRRRRQTNSSRPRGACCRAVASATSRTRSSSPKASGGRVWDVNGKEYVDYLLGSGPDDRRPCASRGRRGRAAAGRQGHDVLRQQRARHPPRRRDRRRGGLRRAGALRQHRLGGRRSTPCGWRAPTRAATRSSSSRAAITA